MYKPNIRARKMIRSSALVDGTKIQCGSLFLIFALLIGACLPVDGFAVGIYDSKQHKFEVSVVTNGLENPWGLVFLPNGRMLVTERPGRLRLIERDGTLLPDPIKGLPETVAFGQGGLLDVALHPDFPKNRLVYLSYSAEGEKGNAGTEVARGRLAGNRLDDVEVIFRALPKSRGGRHFGSRLLFDKTELLYITLGDRGDRPRAQDLGDHAGSIIRVKDNGHMPLDNPLVDRPGALPGIYTYGNRNVQGIAIQPGSELIWAHEHGPQGGDEVNIIRAGTNYGWPVITYGVNYVIGTKIGEGTAKPGLVQPLYNWVPSIGPSGMLFYQGKKFPNWNGDLFVGALKTECLVRLEIQDSKVVDEERLLKGKLGRIRDVRQGPDGLIYLLTDSGKGALIRLEPIS